MNKLFLRKDLAKKSVIQGVTSGLDYGINIGPLLLIAIVDVLHYLLHQQIVSEVLFIFNLN